MSASPENENANPIASLPEIPAATGILWPSLIIGILCSLFGFYLIVTPSKLHSTQPPALNPKRATPTPTKSATAKAADHNIKILDCAIVDSKDSSFALGLESLSKELRASTKGRLDLNVLPGGTVDGAQLDERALAEAVRSKRLTMAVITTSPLTNYNHILDVFDLPFLFQDYKHVDEILDGEIGKELLRSLEDKNLVGLGYQEVGFRIFSSSVPMPNYSSFAGKKLRVMQSVIFTRFAKLIGGDPVPSPVDKIYKMSEEGYIDAADRTYPTYWDFHLYDVHRYITETRHAYSAKMLLINKSVFDSLSKSDQETLYRLAKETFHLQRKMQRKADETVKKNALKEGIEIFELSLQERAKFLNASRELYEEYRANESSKILDAIIKSGKS